MEEQPQLKGYERYEVVVDPRQEPMRLDKFLFDRLVNITRSRVQQAIEEAWVLVNGQTVKANYKVKPADHITVRWHKPKQEGGPQAEDIALDIRYEDSALMVIHKPAGMVVHPGVGVQSGTIANALMHKLKDSDLQAEGNDRPGIVHRIDKNTTGLLLIAKTTQAMQHLAKQFYVHSIERRYHALVWGDLKEEQGRIEGFIGRHPKNRKLRHVFPDETQGKHAVTHYKVLERFGYVTYVECRLETGRTHQIRVHFKHLGHPLFGDVEYGGDKIVKGTIFTKYKQFVQNGLELMPHQALHALSLGFEHPETGVWVQLESELPQNFQALLERWRVYTQHRKL